MNIRIDLGDRSYDIILQRGCIDRTAELLDTDRKCLIVTDSGVPSEYAATVASQCREPLVITVPPGENSKDLTHFEELLKAMLEAGFTRSDCVIAVGGGIPGDLAGFAAASYMRGIDFYNIPTTLLSQADSSIGGKTAVNLGGAKNIAGAFWQPCRVLIDPDVLRTLSEDQLASGMAEIIKAGLIADAELFRYIEEKCLECTLETGAGFVSHLDTDRLLEAALRVKKSVVEEDEREGDRRRILNFGHTIGHGIESVTGMLHGKCVALGMIPMSSPEVRERLIPILNKTGLPVRLDADAEAVFSAMLKDKKMKDGRIAAVYVDSPGSTAVRMTAPEDLRERIYLITKS